ncbi:MAG: type II toxin-antitoxin system VapB family antitoxin [bacterium]
MRTNIVLDEKLVQTAFKYAHVKTKKDLITLALKEFVENHSRLDLRDLQGEIEFSKDYDHKKLRQGKM